MPHAALLEAVLSSPDDDAPRLAYAAALRAEGREDEANRIEKEVHAAAHYVALGEGAVERQRLRYAAREPYSSKAKPGIATVKWGAENGLTGVWEVFSRRGFVESAIVESVTGVGMERVGRLEPILALSIRGPSFDQPARAPGALLACGWMHRLRHLALHGFSAKDDVASVLSRTSHLTSLETLHLASCKIDNARAKQLSEATLPALERLELFDNTFRVAGLEHLLRRFGEKLESLAIEGHPHIDEGWGRVFEKARLPALKSLTLGGPGKDFVFPESFVSTLLGCESLRAVESVTLRGGVLTAASWKALDARIFGGACEIAGFRVDTTDGLRVSAELRNVSAQARRVSPPRLQYGLSDVEYIAGALVFTLDGAPRNTFDGFTVDPESSRRVVLHASSEVAARIPRGTLTFVTGGRPVHFDYAGVPSAA